MQDSRVQGAARQRDATQAPPPQGQTPTKQPTTTAHGENLKRQATTDRHTTERPQGAEVAVSARLQK